MIRLGLLISLIAFLIAAAFSAYGWIHTEPGAQVPVHFNLSGEADRFGSKAEAFLFLPALLLGITFLLGIAPSIDPRGGNLRRSGPIFIAGWIIGVVSLAGGRWSNGGGVPRSSAGTATGSVSSPAEPVAHTVPAGSVTVRPPTSSSVAVVVSPS